MALKKEIELENGIVLNYYRITAINKVTNNVTVIEVSGYISEEKRQEEIEELQNGTEMNVFIHTMFFNKEYVENETIKDLYSYLKTIDVFENAEDV